MNGWRRFWPWRFPFGVKEDRQTALRSQLERDLWEAHRQWKLARERLDQALGADEVDYAVLMLEAAEKRYDMLLRKAKTVGLERAEWRFAATEPVKERADLPQMFAGERKEEAGWTKDG